MSMSLLLVIPGIFLSTLSLRRATRVAMSTMLVSIHFYPRSPCGERPEAFGQVSQMAKDFYPRSPCGERRFSPGTLDARKKFLSTLSLRRATGCRTSKTQSFMISIHALLAESDPQPAQLHSFQPYFYPRSPCGERQASSNTLLTR